MVTCRMTLYYRMYPNSAIIITVSKEAPDSKQWRKKTNPTAVPRR